MSAIGVAIKASQGIIAIIDKKFCGSTYCNDELAMAKGCGLQLFPILFRGMRFDALPAGLHYMLASINVIPFPDEESDQACLERLLHQMRNQFGAASAPSHMRSASSKRAAARWPAASARASSPAACACTMTVSIALALPSRSAGGA